MPLASQEQVRVTSNVRCDSLADARARLQITFSSIFDDIKMSDTEVGAEDVQELDQLKQSATRRKGRGFAGTGDATEVHGAYDTLKGDGPGPQRSIDVRSLALFVTTLSFIDSGLDDLCLGHQ